MSHRLTLVAGSGTHDLFDRKCVRRASYRSFIEWNGSLLSRSSRTQSGQQRVSGLPCQHPATFKRITFFLADSRGPIREFRINPRPRSRPRSSSGADF